MKQASLYPRIVAEAFILLHAVYAGNCVQLFYHIHSCKLFSLYCFIVEATFLFSSTVNHKMAY